MLSAEISNSCKSTFLYLLRTGENNCLKAFEIINKHDEFKKKAS
jgi:hypothetical protein